MARLASVSPTTVSHALNEKGRVNDATRDRVLVAAERLGYRPSHAARALRTKRNGTLGFLIPSVEAPAAARGLLASLDIYMTLATAAAQAAFREDHALVLVPPTASASDLHRLGIDGGIICDPAADEPLVDLFESMHLPFVTIDRQPGRADSKWFVAADNGASTTLLLDHLEERGARRIALISVDAPIAWALDSRAAYDAWVAARGMPPLVAELSPHDQQRTAYTAAISLLDDPDPPDAVIALDERFPPGVIRAARERHLAIPDDLMLAIGIDNPRAAASTPSVTAIDIHPHLQGIAAVEMLLARLRGTPTQAPRITRATLHVRDSTRRTRSERASDPLRERRVAPSVPG